MPYPSDWKLCRMWDCSERALLPALKDRTSARLWLQFFLQDSSTMRTMRAFLATELGSTDLSRVADQEVVSRLADLLASGRVHLHPPGSQAAAAPQGGQTVQPTKAVAAQPAAFPLPKRGLTVQEAASTGIEAILESFLPDVDLVAQAATLVAAASSGKAFCPE